MKLFLIFIAGFCASCAPRSFSLATLALPAARHITYDVQPCHCIHSDSAGFAVLIEKHIELSSETFIDSGTALFWCAQTKEYLLTQRTKSIPFPHPAFTLSPVSTRALP